GVTFCSGGGGAVCVHDPRSTSSSLLALAPGPWTLPAPDTELHARRRIGARLTAAGVVLIRAPREPAAAAVGGHVRSPGDWRGTPAPARAPQEDRAPNGRCNPARRSSWSPAARGGSACSRVPPTCRGRTAPGPRRVKRATGARLR